jgi:predicted nucleic acid-binding protein
LSFVVDASIALSWYLPGETSATSEAAFARLRDTDAIAPILWWFEIRNTLVVSERRKRITPAQTIQILTRLGELPLRLDVTPDSAVVMALARDHGLTVYDAAYLELAGRLVIPLATLDRALADAAPAAGIELLTA